MTAYKLALLIDDDDIGNFLIERMLLLNGFAEQVIAITSIEKALSYLQSCEQEGHKHPDVIFLDIDMPVQNGWEFLDTYSQLPENVKEKSLIYILSSSISNSDVVRSRNYKDVVDFISKPLTKAKIEELKQPIDSNSKNA